MKKSESETSLFYLIFASEDHLRDRTNSLLVKVPSRLNSVCRFNLLRGPLTA